jgi:hypothetical protein
VGGVAFVVVGQASSHRDPGKGTLNRPRLGLDLESTLTWLFADDVQVSPQGVGGPLDQPAGDMHCQEQAERSESGRTSWSALLDAVRLTPGADLAAVTARQVREVVERLVAAGFWTEGDPDILIVLDAGYDAPRISYLVSGLPVEIPGQTRSDRVVRRPASSREELFRAHPKGGRMQKHGEEFVFGDPSTWGEEQAVTVTDTVSTARPPRGPVSWRATQSTGARPSSSEAECVDADAPFPARDPLACVDALTGRGHIG